MGTFFCYFLSFQSDWDWFFFSPFYYLIFFEQFTSDNSKVRYAFGKACGVCLFESLKRASDADEQINQVLTTISNAFLKGKSYENITSYNYSKICYLNKKIQ